jgi:hypothetical protein
VGDVKKDCRFGLWFWSLVFAINVLKQKNINEDQRSKTKSEIGNGKSEIANVLRVVSSGS